MSLSPTGTGIGQPVRRREDLRLLTGRGRYSDDINVPGQAYAVMVRSPHAHALIRSIDVAAASAAPGVLAVLTGHDLLADGLKPIPHAVRTGHPADIQLENTDGSPPFIPPHYPMAADEVRHVGDIVAMVVADSLAAAKDAAELRRGGLRGTAGGGPFPRTRSPRTRRCAWSDAASNVCLDAEVGDAAATEAAFAAAAHVVRFEHLGAAHRRRDDGAARGDRRVRRRDRTLHAARRRRRRGAAAARHGGGARRRGRAGAHGDARCRRQFRHARRIQSGIRAGRLGGAARRPPGEVDLRAQRGIPVRLSGARPDGRCRTGARCARARSWRCAAPTSSTAAPIPSRSARCTRASRS